jgi:hypothetical protein
LTLVHADVYVRPREEDTQEQFDMRPIGWGLAAALFVAALAPVAVFSATRGAEVSKEQREQGMKEAPAAAQSAGLTCQVSDARFIGKASDPKTRVATSYYEVACSQGMGYVLSAPAGSAASAFSCLELAPPPGQAPKQGSLTCGLPANADPKAALGPMLTKAGIACTPDKARGIGQTKTNTLIEVSCQTGEGYIVIGSAPLDPTKDVQAQNCLNFDDGDGNVKCELSTKAARLAIVDRYAQGVANGCVIKDRRFMGTIKDGSDYYEVACQDGKGYIYKVSAGKLADTYGCAQGQGILGGCTLTDARQATAEQAALYTKLAHASGSACDVDHYALFANRGNDEVVELACKDGAGAIGIFPATGKGQVVDCARALALGYKCSLTKDEGFGALTADLRRFNQKTCTVSNSRVMGKTAKGTVLVEVACSDGFKGYVIEYSVDPTVNAVGATGCAFAGGCKLPGNV